VQAYAGVPPEYVPVYGFVKLNGSVVWEGSWGGNKPNVRGVSTLVIDAFDCALREYRHYDTHDSEDAASTALSDYLQQLDNGRVIAAVTGDEPTRQLASAVSTLLQLGAEVSDVQYRGSFGFVAQKGYPSKTVLRKVLTGEDSKTQQPHFTVVVRGRPTRCCQHN